MARILHNEKLSDLPTIPYTYTQHLPNNPNMGQLFGRNNGAELGARAGGIAGTQMGVPHFRPRHPPECDAPPFIYVPPLYHSKQKSLLKYFLKNTKRGFLLIE